MEPTNAKRARLVELLQQASGGSEAAFAELYEMTNTYLYHVALRIVGTRPCAEEVMQEAYLSIWQEARRYRPDLGSAMTWLITIVRNKAFSILRTQRIDRHAISLEGTGKVLDSVAVLPAEDTDALQSAFYSAARMRLPAAMALLPAPQRQAIALNFFFDMPHAELSTHFGVPLGTVKSWVRRGMVRLNAHLSNAGTAAATDAAPPSASDGFAYQRAA